MTNAKTDENKTANVPILYRHPKSHLIESVISEYEGPLSAKVWQNLNRELLKLDACAYFYPLDAMDAYNTAVVEVTKAARAIADGKIVLQSAAPDTYLANVARKSLKHFINRQVEPQRATYRHSFAQIFGHGAVGEDGFDSDNYDGTQDTASRTMRDTLEDIPGAKPRHGGAMTTQQLAETLPAIPWESERIREARFRLGEICDALLKASADNAVIVKAFVAYVATDGNLVETARRLKMSKTVFYRKWPMWLDLAKKVGKK